MPFSKTVLSKHVDYRWVDAEAANLSEPERLVYRSNLLGSDQRITNTGGGNTSAKVVERDPLTGEAVEVLWVRGSVGQGIGRRLAHQHPREFRVALRGKLLGLQERYQAFTERGRKTPAEDWMPAMYPHCTFNLNPCAASIDTPLHAFVPAKHCDHTHPNAVIAIAASRRSEELARKIFAPKQDGCRGCGRVSNWGWKSSGARRPTRS